MKERIIFAPGANGTEIIKSMALFGINCFNFRICGAGELAEIALMRSGITFDEDILINIQENAIISKAVKSEKYYGRTTYSDIKEIATAVRTMRSLVTGDDEDAEIEAALSKGSFSEKNKALLNTYRNYMHILKDGNLTDRISVIKKAAKESIKLDAEFVVLREYPLNPIESKLLERVSGGNYTQSSLGELFLLENKAITVNSYKNCYGMSNEVETVLTEIYKNKNLDKCTIAVSDPLSYGQLFYDYALLYDMPISFGAGIPILNSNPAKLLVLYKNWISGGMFTAGNLMDMLTSEVFDSDVFWKEQKSGDDKFSRFVFYELIGSLRLTNNGAVNDARVVALKKALEEEKNELPAGDEKAGLLIEKKLACIPYVDAIAKELALPVELFIDKYSYIRKGSGSNAAKLVMDLDMSARSAIKQLLVVIRETDADRELDDIIKNVLSTAVKTKGSEPGKLYISDIKSAMSVPRENLYILGISATKYPGAPREDFLLLDEDIHNFGEWAKRWDSAGRIAGKKDDFMNLVSFAAQKGCKINVSFPGLNVSELKKDNASSVIFELFRLEKGDSASLQELNSEITQVEYFAPEISNGREVGRAYVSGYTVYPNEEKRQADINPVILDADTEIIIDADSDEMIIESDEELWTGADTDECADDYVSEWGSKYLDREYSPSAIEMFFGCPARFFYHYILGIPEEEEERPFEVISAIDVGNLAHELMERLGNSSMTREEFLKISEACFDRFMTINPTLIANRIGIAKTEFLEMMGYAYDADPHRDVVINEKELHCEHSSGIKIKGFPDRVERLDNGNYLVVDFKTKREIAHREDDPLSCIQVMLYALLMEQNGYEGEIEAGEYRYLRLMQSVTCKNTDEMKERLTQLLLEFKDAINSCRFPKCENKENNNACKNCSYSSICNGGDF